LEVSRYKLFLYSLPVVAALLASLQRFNSLMTKDAERNLWRWASWSYRVGQVEFCKQ